MTGTIPGVLPENEKRGPRHGFPRSSHHSKRTNLTWVTPAPSPTSFEQIKLLGAFIFGNKPAKSFRRLHRVAEVP